MNLRVLDEVSVNRSSDIDEGSPPAFGQFLGTQRDFLVEAVPPISEPSKDLRLLGKELSPDEPDRARMNCPLVQEQTPELLLV